MINGARASAVQSGGLGPRVWRRLAWRVLACVATVATSSARARAAAEPADVAAETLFQQGRALMAAGRVMEACQKFSESNRIDPATGALLNLAVCNETLGKIATAWVQFRAAETAAESAQRSDRVALAREHLAALLPRLSHLIIEVPDSVRLLRGLQVSVDGTVLREAAWNIPVPIDPGAHRVLAEAPGRDPGVFAVRVGPHPQVVSVLIRLGPSLPSAGKSTAVADTSVSTSVSSSVSSSAAGAVGAGGPSTLRIWAYGTGAVGVAALVAGTIFGLRAFSKWDDRNHSCPMELCDAAGNRAQVGAENAARNANVAVVVGLVSLTASAYLLFRGREDAPRSADIPRTPRWSLNPSVSLEQTGLVLKGGW